MFKRWLRGEFCVHGDPLSWEEKPHIMKTYPDVGSSFGAGESGEFDLTVQDTMAAESLSNSFHRSRSITRHKVWVGKPSVLLFIPRSSTLLIFILVFLHSTSNLCLFKLDVGGSIGLVDQSSLKVYLPREVHQERVILMSACISTTQEPKDYIPIQANAASHVNMSK